MLLRLLLHPSGADMQPSTRHPSSGRVWHLYGARGGAKEGQSDKGTTLSPMPGPGFEPGWGYPRGILSSSKRKIGDHDRPARRCDCGTCATAVLSTVVCSCLVFGHRFGHRCLPALRAPVTPPQPHEAPACVKAGSSAGALPSGRVFRAGLPLEKKLQAPLPEQSGIHGIATPP